MLVKWITCGPTDRAAFGVGQQAWGELHGVPGFLGQGGGWSRNTIGVAQIFGLWRDLSSYQAFMDRAHDRLAAAQAGTFDELRVRIFGRRLDIGDGFPVDFRRPALSVICSCQW